MAHRSGELTWSAMAKRAKERDGVKRDRTCAGRGFLQAGRPTRVRIVALHKNIPCIELAVAAPYGTRGAHAPLEPYAVRDVHAPPSPADRTLPEIRGSGAFPAGPARPLAWVTAGLGLLGGRNGGPNLSVKRPGLQGHARYGARLP